LRPSSEARGGPELVEGLTAAAQVGRSAAAFAKLPRNILILFRVTAPVGAPPAARIA
jgi:hypothetical protein